MDLGKAMGHEQHLLPLESRAYAAPASLTGELAAGEPSVFFLLDLVVELDLGEIHAYYGQRDPRGEKAYDLRMMVVLILYSYCVGLPSSRKIEKACWEDAAFRVLTGNQQPEHSRISDFRRRHLSALAGLFVQVLKVCQKAGLVSLGHVALDGT
jgi:transposase